MVLKALLFITLTKKSKEFRKTYSLFKISLVIYLELFPATVLQKIFLISSLGNMFSLDICQTQTMVFHWNFNLTEQQWRHQYREMSKEVIT